LFRPHLSFLALKKAPQTSVLAIESMAAAGKSTIGGAMEQNQV
jgi:hypothetical protein